MELELKFKVEEKEVYSHITCKPSKTQTVWVLTAIVDKNNIHPCGCYKWKKKPSVAEINRKVVLVRECILIGISCRERAYQRAREEMHIPAPSDAIPVVPLVPLKSRKKK